MKHFNGSTAKAPKKFYTYHRSGSQLFLLTVALRVLEDPITRHVAVTVFKNSGAIPADDDGPQGGFLPAPTPFILKGNGAGERVASFPIILQEDDELSYSVSRFGSGEGLPPWEVDFRLSKLTEDL